MILDVTCDFTSEVFPVEVPASGVYMCPGCGRTCDVYSSERHHGPMEDEEPVAPSMMNEPIIEEMVFVSYRCPWPQCRWWGHQIMRDDVENENEYKDLADREFAEHLEEHH